MEIGVFIYFIGFYVWKVYFKNIFIKIKDFFSILKYFS